MKLMLMGCGAVGIAVAAALYDAGSDPDLVAQGETLKAIREGGIARRGIFKDVTVPKDRVKVYESVKAAGRAGYDYVIVCCKTTVSPIVAEELGSVPGLLADSGKIVLFQNGFDNERPFLKYFDREKLLAASIITGFERPKRNVSLVTVHSASALIGSLRGGDGGAAPLAAAISAGGFPCETSADIVKAIWSKMLYNCTLNPLSAVLGTNYGGLLASPDAVKLMDGIVEEIFAVMKAAGYAARWPDAKAYKKDFYTKILPPTAGHRASTLQDMERRIKTEIDSLTGVVVRLGEEYGVPVPVNTMLYRLVKAKESLYTYEA